MVQIFSVEGNIGSGKSTLVSILREYYSDNEDVIFLMEPVEIWETIKDDSGENIISKFYKNQEKYSFAFQMMAYISRLHQLREMIREHPDATIICERSLFTDKNVFAKMLYDDGKIEDIEYKIYLKWFYEFIHDIPITGLVYVRASPEKCQERVLKRAREGETIPLEYLENCHKYHEEWISKEISNTLTLDANEDKEYREEDYSVWIAIIDKFIEMQKDKDMTTDLTEIKEICSSCNGV